MAWKWLDPGGGAMGGTELLTSPTSGVTAQTSVKPSWQAYAYKMDTTATPANQQIRRDGIIAAGPPAVGRCSRYINFPATPTGDTNVRLLYFGPAGGGVTATFLSVVLDSARKLRLYTTGVTTQLGATGSTVLNTSQWYRITMSFTYTSTTNWGCKVYIDGNLEMTRTNADGTLATGTPSAIGTYVASGAGTSWLLYVSDLAVDDTSDQSDFGTDCRVGRRAVTTVSSGGWDTTVGTGSLIERPLSTANRIDELATGPATVDYNVEAASAGDADLTGATILGRAAFAWFTLSSLTGTPTGTLRIDGAGVGSAMDPAVAGTYELKWAADTATTYPSTVGVTSSGIAADTSVAELGAIVAYIPAAPTTKSPPPFQRIWRRQPTTRWRS